MAGEKVLKITLFSGPSDIRKHIFPQALTAVDSADLSVSLCPSNGHEGLVNVHGPDLVFQDSVFDSEESLRAAFALVKTGKPLDSLQVEIRHRSAIAASSLRDFLYDPDGRRYSSRAFCRVSIVDLAPCS